MQAKQECDGQWPKAVAASLSHPKGVKQVPPQGGGLFSPGRIPLWRGVVTVVVVVAAAATAVGSGGSSVATAIVAFVVVVLLRGAILLLALLFLLLPLAVLLVSEAHEAAHVADVVVGGGDA